MMKDECRMMNWQNESSSLDFYELRKDFSPPVMPSLTMSELMGWWKSCAKGG